MTYINSDNAEKILQEAIQNHRSGNITKAKQLYEKIIASYDNAPHAHHNLSIIMRGEGNIDATLYHLRQARELGPSVEQFWKSSFTALISANQWKELLNVLETALVHHQYNPTLVDAIIETDVLNSICASVAEETLESFIFQLAKILPKDNLLDKVRSLEKPPVKILKKIASLYVEKSHNKKLERLLEQKKYSELIKWSKPYLTVRQSSEVLYVAIAKSFFALKKVHDAKKICEYLFKWQIKSSEAYNIYASCLASEKNYRDAEIIWKKSIDTDPKHVRSYFNLGKLYESKGDLISAITCFTEAVAIEPNFSNGLLSLATIYHKTKNYPAAIEAYKKCLGSNPNMTQCALNLASLYIDTDQLTEAKICLC